MQAVFDLLHCKVGVRVSFVLFFFFWMEMTVIPFGPYNDIAHAHSYTHTYPRIFFPPQQLKNKSLVSKLPLALTPNITNWTHCYGRRALWGKTRSETSP